MGYQNTDIYGKMNWNGKEYWIKGNRGDAALIGTEVVPVGVSKREDILIPMEEYRKLNGNHSSTSVHKGA